MPLMQGKSNRSFEHNIKAEMNSGKPQKQALAIAYSVRRRMAKKKAENPEEHGNEMAKGGFPQVQSPGTFNEDAKKYMAKKAYGGMINEDLNPHDEPEQSAEDSMYAQYRFPKSKFEHEQMEHPTEFKEHIKPSPDNLPEYMMAEGGEVKKPKLGTGKRFDHLEHSLSHEKGIYDPAGLAAAIGRKKYGEKKMDALSHHEHMAYGGMYPVEKDREYAEGGMVYPFTESKIADGSNDEESTIDRSIHNFGIDNLSDIDSHPDDDFLSDEEQTPYFHENDRDEFEPSQKRKRMIEGIMRNLHSRHYGT